MRRLNLYCHDVASVFAPLQLVFVVSLLTPRMCGSSRGMTKASPCISDSAALKGFALESNPCVLFLSVIGGSSERQAIDSQARVD